MLKLVVRKETARGSKVKEDKNIMSYILVTVQTEIWPASSLSWYSEMSERPEEDKTNACAKHSSQITAESPEQGEDVMSVWYSVQSNTYHIISINKPV